MTETTNNEMGTSPLGPKKSGGWIKTALRILFAIFYFYAGYAHIAAPASFLQITPPWVPYPESVIYWTGIIEMAAGLALAQPFLKRMQYVAGLTLAFYALCVWPANFHHFILDQASVDWAMSNGAGLAYHVPRLAAQPVLIWLALWLGGVVHGPIWKPRLQE